MPEIEKVQLDSMLKQVPEERRLAFLQDFKQRGFTIKGMAPASAAPPIKAQFDDAPIQPIIPGVAELPSAMNKAAEFGRETAPNYIAQKVGVDMGMPKTGAVAAGLVKGTAEAIPLKPVEVGTQLLLGPLMKAAGATYDAIRPWVGKAAKSLLARDIGVAEPFIENVVKNPAALKQIASDPAVVTEHAATMGKILKRGLDRAGDGLNEIEGKFITQAQRSQFMKKVPVSDVLENFKTAILTRGGSVEEKVGRKTVEKSLSKIQSITGSDATKLAEYMDDVRKIEKGATFLDLMNLRRKIGADVTWPTGEAPKVGSEASRLLKGLRDEVNQKLYKIAPDLREADSTYSTARKAYDELQKKVFGGTPEEAYQRVRLRIMKGVAPTALLERAAAINTTTEKAMKKLIEKVSAQEFAPYVRKGIAGSGATLSGIGSMGATMLMHGNPAPMALWGTALAASSPRMGAMAIRGQSGLAGMAQSIAQLAQTNPTAARALLQSLQQNPSQPPQGQP